MITRTGVVPVGTDAGCTGLGPGLALPKGGTTRDCGAGLRVLVAEDEHLTAMVIGEALTDAGHSALLAGDGKAALAMAATNAFDVLLTDLAMPRMTGWELIPRLRAQWPELPIVVMTGFLPPGGQEVLFADAKGPLAILLKPFEIGHLLETLTRVILVRPPAGD